MTRIDTISYPTSSYGTSSYIASLSKDMQDDGIFNNSIINSNTSSVSGSIYNTNSQFDGFHYNQTADTNKDGKIDINEVLAFINSCNGATATPAATDDTAATEITDTPDATSDEGESTEEESGDIGVDNKKLATVNPQLALAKATFEKTGEFLDKTGEATKDAYKEEINKAKDSKADKGLAAANPVVEAHKIVITSTCKAVKKVFKGW